MFLRQVFLGILGASFGLFTAGGVFTVLIAVGLVPRFAGKLHVAGKILIFEEAVVLGTLAGNFFSVFENLGSLGDFVLEHQLFGLGYTGMIWEWIGSGMLIFFGLFAGLFVGCLALAIAEMLDTIPIFSRRIGFRHGLGIAVLSMALGKVAGSLLYFIKEVYLYGGL